MSVTLTGTVTFNLVCTEPSPQCLCPNSTNLPVDLNEVLCPKSTDLPIDVDEVLCLDWAEFPFDLNEDLCPKSSDFPSDLNEVSCQNSNDPLIYLNQVLCPSWTDYPFNLNAITFAEMTKLVDVLRTTVFIPLFSQVYTMFPALNPAEVTKLNSIAVDLCRYDRAPALDRRGEWPFLAIAGPHEVWTAEVLLAMFSAQEYFWGYENINGKVREVGQFLSGLQTRLPLI